MDINSITVFYGARILKKQAMENTLIVLGAKIIFKVIIVRGLFFLSHVFIFKIDRPLGKRHWIIWLFYGL